MGLYLTVFDGDEELDGVDVGSYADFATFRSAVTNCLEGEKPGSRFPTLILHSDCDGQWSPIESSALEGELRVIDEEFRKLPPTELDGEWKRQVAKAFGMQLKTIYDCFFDVDGEPLVERLIRLATLSRQHNLPILFQ